VRIETARLALRPLDAADLGVIERINTDPELMAHIHHGLPHRRDECRADLERGLTTWRDHGYGTFVAERDGELVGTVGFGRPDWCPSALPGVDIGWTIVQEQQRNGYATEAGAALLRWFFDAALGGRVVGIHNTDNPRSGAVMRRLGMRWLRQLPHPQLGYPIELWEAASATWRPPARASERVTAVVGRAGERGS
jgi:RimJ/RimL family protein N-acetyltransferase